jgi:hypothetical protein
MAGADCETLFRPGRRLIFRVNPNLDPFLQQLRQGITQLLFSTFSFFLLWEKDLLCPQIEHNRNDNQEIGRKHGDFLGMKDLMSVSQHLFPIPETPSSLCPDEWLDP